MAINADIRLRLKGGDKAQSEMDKLSDTVDRVNTDADNISLEPLAEDAEEANRSIGDMYGNFKKAGGPAIAVGAALFAAADAAADTALEADVLATALETDVETAGRMAVAFGKVGIEANDITDIALQIGGALTTDEELAARLGLTIEEAQDPVEALSAGIDGWKFLTAQERAAAFGEEGVRQISAMIASGKNFEEILADVEGTQILNEADVESAREMKEALADLKGQFDGAVLTVGQEFIPVLIDATDQLDALLSLDLQSFGAGVLENMVDPFNLVSRAIEKAGGPTTWAGLLNKLGFIDELEISVGSVELALLDLKGEASLTGEEFTETGLKGVEAMTDVEIAAGRAKEAMNDWKNSLNIDAAAAQLEAAFHGAMLNNEEDAAAAERATINWLEQLGDVPEEVITDIRAEFDEGSLASIFATLDAIRREAGRPIPLGRYVPPSGFQPGAPDGVQRTTNVNVTMAGTPSSRELASTLAYWEARG